MTQLDSEQQLGGAAAAGALPRAADRGRRRRKALHIATIGASLLAFALCWHLMSTYLFNEKLLPGPLKVVATAVPMFVEDGLIGHVLISLQRVIAGFAIGAVAAIVVGLLVGRVRFFDALISPPLQFLRFLSPTALIPVAIIWFGIAESSKVFLIFWATFLFSVVTIIQGAKSIPDTRIRSAHSIGATTQATLWKVVLPSSVPFIVGGLRTAVAASFMSIIPAELLAAQSGLGYLLSQYTITMDTPRVFVVLTVFGCLGFLTDLVFRLSTGVFLRRYLIT